MNNNPRPIWTLTEVFLIYCGQEAENSLNSIMEAMTKGGEPREVMDKIWLNLLSLRSQSYADVVFNDLRGIVAAGPFKGLNLSFSKTAHPAACVMLGHYEHELHETIESLVRTPYEVILNIGCAYGYYAGGMALRMPEAHIKAYDINERARSCCVEVARINGLSERLEVFGLFNGDDFDHYGRQRTLAIVDIEGAEEELLYPAAFPKLRNIDVLVEMHECLRPGIAKLLIDRFSPTHTVEVISNRLAYPNLSPLVPDSVFVSDFDAFLMGWESRVGGHAMGSVPF